QIFTLSISAYIHTFLRLTTLILLCNSFRLPQHLHSFPTRRSSDLRSAPNVTVAHANDPRRRTARSSFSRNLMLNDDLAVRRRGRSEEHTSELQSHLNLVCRLLLEKKKQKNKTHSYTI